MKQIPKKEIIIIVVIMVTAISSFFLFSKSIDMIINTLDELISDNKEEIRIVLYKANFDLIKDV